MGSSISQISHRDIGGVPVLWAPQPQGSPFLAQLVFRVGISDETLPFRGITHLVEHLALPVTHTPPVEFNGVVMGSFTRFWFSGPREAVLRLLEETCTALADPPLSRLDRELLLLTTEAETYAPGALGGALALRFGAAGHGLPGFGDVGLPRLTRDDVSRWAAERFNLGTVSLAFSGEPPPKLELPLPDGTRVDPAPLKPIRDLDTPSVFAYAAEGGVWATLTGRRSYEMNAVLWTLQQRLSHRLRGRRSLSYNVVVDFEPLTSGQLHVFAHADCLLQNQDAVAATIVATIDELAANGPTGIELEEYVAERERDDANDAFLAEMLFWHAGEAAFGQPFKSPADLSAGARGVDSATAADALREASSTLMLGIAPGGSVPTGRFTRYPLDSRHRVEGRRYRRRGLRFLGRKDNEQQLIVGPEGITLVGEDPFLEEKYVRTVLFKELAAAVFFEDGVIELYGLDGHLIVVDLMIWRRSDALTDLIKQSIPNEVLVDLRAGTSSFTDDDLAAGEAAFEEKDWVPAISLLTSGLEREPDDEYAWWLLGAAHLQVQNRTAAVEAGRKAVELDPEDAAPRRLLTHALHELGRDEEAVEHTRKLLDLDPGDLSTLKLAVFVLVNGSFEREALEIAESAVELFPESFEAHFAHGWAAQALGDFTQGRISLERAVALDPTHGMAHNNLGWVLLQLGEPGAALSEFDRTLQLDPANTFAGKNRSLALRLAGRHEESEQAWRAWGEAQLEKYLAVLDVDPLDEDALWHRAMMAWYLGRDEEALSFARDAAERLPENAELRRWQANAELVMENDEQATNATEKALVLESESFDARVFAAWYGAFSGRQQERATQAGREALELRRDSARGFAAAGYGALAAGNHDDAARCFDKVIERAPLHCCSFAGRALAYLTARDYEQAERDIRQALIVSHGRCMDALIAKARLRLGEKAPA